MQSLQTDFAYLNICIFLLISVTVGQTIVVEYEVSFLVTAVSGNRITCKTAFSIGLKPNQMISAGKWYVADFSAPAVSSHCAMTIRVGISFTGWGQ